MKLVIVKVCPFLRDNLHILPSNCIGNKSERKSSLSDTLFWLILANVCVGTWQWMLHLIFLIQVVLMNHSDCYFVMHVIWILL